MSEYKRPLLPCGCDSTVDISVDGFQTTTCHNCGRQLTDLEKWRLAEENEKRIRQAECPHVLTTMHMDGTGIHSHTCDACGADRPLPEAKPPRRMLKPRKAVLYAELRDHKVELREIKVELAAATAEIEASDRALQAMREAYQRLWAETHGLCSDNLLDRARRWISTWWNRRGFANGGLTGRGYPALIASRDNQSEEPPHG